MTERVIKLQPIGPRRGEISTPQGPDARCPYSGKRRFASEEDALGALTYWRKARPSMIQGGTAYACRHCGGFHITRGRPPGA